MPEEQSFTKKSTFSRRLKAFLLVALVVVLILVCVSALLQFAARSELGKQIDRARALNVPLTFAELQADLRRIPHDENSARIIEELIPELEALRSKYQESPDLPVLGKAVFPPINRPWRTDSVNAIEDFVNAHGDLIDALAPIQNMPQGRFEVKFAKNPMEIFIPHVGPSHNAARALCLNALAEAHKGNFEHAARSISASLNISGAMDNDLCFIGVLQGFRIDDSVASTLERILTLEKESNELFTALSSGWNHRSNPHRFLVGLERDLVLIMEAYSYMNRTAFGRGRWILGGSGLVEPMSASTRATLKLSGSLMLNHAKSLELFLPVLENIDSFQKCRDACLTTKSEANALPSTYFIAQDYHANWVRALEITTSSLARTRCVIAALAAERYRSNHGEWPVTLDDLGPEYLESVPFDPFDEQPLRFKRTAYGICIYSINANLNDDGGDLVPVESNSTQLRDVGFRLLDPDKRATIP